MQRSTSNPAGRTAARINLAQSGVSRPKSSLHGELRKSLGTLNGTTNSPCHDVSAVYMLFPSPVADYLSNCSLPQVRRSSNGLDSLSSISPARDSNLPLRVSILSIMCLWGIDYTQDILQRIDNVPPLPKYYGIKGPFPLGHHFVICEYYVSAIRSSTRQSSFMSRTHSIAQNPLNLSQHSL